MIASTILTTLLFKLAVFVFILGVLVTVHELGHFLFAKLFNVGVIEFAVGFGPKLLSKKFGETIYSIRAIPLGGFVRMVGDDPRVVAQGELGYSPKDSEEEAERAFTTDQSRWFLKQGFWAKFLIVFAGPAFNFILAFVLCFSGHALFGVNELIDQPIVGEVVKGLPAEKAGLKKDDKIIAVGDILPTTWRGLAEAINAKAGEGVNLKVQRENKELKFFIKGELGDKDEAEVTGNARRFQIGIIGPGKVRFVSTGEAFSIAAEEIAMLTNMTFQGIVSMVSGSVSPKNIRGPIFIFHQAGEFAERGVYQLIRFMMFLSISLAVLNLLPVPVLDGGHLVIFILELVIRRPLSLAAQERAAQVGMVLLLLLMVFAVGNDLSSLVTG
jgi:regulator of sigma E protease